jgi:hypothetical protein
MDCETCKFLIVWKITVILRVIRVGFLVDKVTLRQIFLSEYFMFPGQNPSASYVIILSRITDAV